jgi:uncharacterized protein (DUF2062 family)
MKLNKIVAVVFSNISIPPMIPFILYGSMLIGARILNIENVFLVENISLEVVGQSFGQYLIGSIALAAISGILIFITSLIVMIICKRKS